MKNLFSLKSVIVLVFTTSLLNACANSQGGADVADSQLQEESGMQLADNEIEEIANEEKALELDDSAIAALQTVAEENSAADPETDLANNKASFKALKMSELINYNAIPHSNTVPSYVEEIIPGHNKADRKNRENLIFVGYGNHSAAYFKAQIAKIIDFNGEGTGAVGSKEYGLFGQPVFKGSQKKFNFWYIDPAKAGIAFKRSTQSLCALEGNFEGLEDDLLEDFNFKYKTFIHLLSDTDCRSQANWFRINPVSDIGNLVSKAFSWSKFSTNLTEVKRGKMSFYRAFIESINFNLIATTTLSLETHPRIFLNMYDHYLTESSSYIAAVAVHEMGHAFVRFMDEYAEYKLVDVLNFDKLQASLDKGYNLTSLLPTWIVRTFGIPSVSINLFQELLKQFDFMGPNCAGTYDQATSKWGSFAGQGSGAQKIQTTVGCLYLNNVFYRSSSDSRMRNSRAPFNVFQENYIKKNFLDIRAE